MSNTQHKSDCTKSFESIYGDDLFHSYCEYCYKQYAKEVQPMNYGQWLNKYHA